MQDLSEDMMAQSQHLITKEDLHGRITFMKHDFFTDQPIHEADAFLIRQVIHNYTDEECERILRAFVPALEACKPGTPILINDTILPEYRARTKLEEGNLRQLDIAMLVTLGAKQRTLEDFERLVKRADQRFKVGRLPENLSVSGC